MTDMKTPSILIIFTLLFSLAFGCNKDASLFQSKGNVSSFISGKGSASGAEKSLFSSNSNYTALFEVYKNTFVDFRDSLIQNEGLSSWHTSLPSFGDCIDEDSTDLNCFSFISNLADASAVNAYFSAVATHLSALRGNYSSLTDAEFSETFELTVQASLRTHYAANPLTAILNIELEEVEPPAEFPTCYEELQDNVMIADALYISATIGCLFLGPGAMPCFMGASMGYGAGLIVAGEIYCDCMNDNYGYNC
jgi:hypothetical protein